MRSHTAVMPSVPTNANTSTMIHHASLMFQSQLALALAVVPFTSTDALRVGDHVAKRSTVGAGTTLAVGCVDGVAVGMLDGVAEGMLDGLAEGRDVGRREGRGVGRLDGADDDGAADGLLVTGDADGRGVGGVGDVVGAAVQSPPSKSHARTAHGALHRLFLRRNGGHCGAQSCAVVHLIAATSAHGNTAKFDPSTNGAFAGRGLRMLGSQNVPTAAGFSRQCMTLRHLLVAA